MDPKNTFLGKNAILDFLNPDKGVYTPLVEIPEQLNPCAEDGVHIYAKLLNMLPLTNVKSLPAFKMLDQEKAKGGLKGVHTIIENSSGNTVLSLAVLGKLFGIEHTQAFVSHEILPGKLQMLQLFGVKCIVNEEPICPDPSDTNSGIYKAKEMGKLEGWFNAGQYENYANPQAHEQWTGPQIYEQLQGNIQILCAGMGTTGTLVGTSRFLKGKNPSLCTVGILRSPNNPVPGVRTRGLLGMIAFDWKKYTDYFEEVDTKNSFEKSLLLIRNGIVVGPSSGFSFAGLLQFLENRKREKTLDSLRDKNGEIHAVFICCDSPLPYLKEYFTYLDASYFPEIEHAELLINKPTKKVSYKKENSFEISAEETFSQLYSDSAEIIERKLLHNEEIKIQNGICIIDCRSKKEFDHFHIPGSELIEYEHFIEYLSALSSRLHNIKVILICTYGLKSHSLARTLQLEFGIEAYSLKGGILEWSHLHLPRWKPDICLKRK